jgi:hypothetical protein
MPFNFQIRDDLVEVRFHGNVTGNDLDQLLDIIEDIELRWEATPDRVSDLSDAIMSDLSSQYLEAFAKARNVANLKNAVKSAIIAPGTEQYGLARMFMAYNRNPKISIMLFKDSASAYKWIGHEPKSVNDPNA